MAKFVQPLAPKKRARARSCCRMGSTLELPVPLMQVCDQSVLAIDGLRLALGPSQVAEPFTASTACASTGFTLRPLA